MATFAAHGDAEVAAIGEEPRVLLDAAVAARRGHAALPEHEQRLAPVRMRSDSPGEAAQRLKVKSPFTQRHNVLSYYFCNERVDPST